MTKILPFKAYRYTSRAGNLSDLVISQSDNGQAGPKSVFALAHLVKDQDPVALFNAWKSQGILKQDPSPCIYTFRQEYFIENEPILKKGFICKIQLSGDNLSSILEHEHVIEQGIDYHLDVLKRTQLIVHPIMGMYADGEFELENAIDESFIRPISSISNNTGGTDTFGAICDPESIKKFVKLLSSKTIFLADGHHRFRASVKYSNLPNGRDGSKSTIVYLSNMEDRNFQVFPYHRLYSGIKSFGEDDFIRALQKYFSIEPLRGLNALSKRLNSELLHLGLITKTKTLLLTLRDEKKSLLYRSISQGKHFINFSIIKEKIFAKSLKLSAINTTLRINYETNLARCYEEVLFERAQLAIISPKISPKELKMIAEKRIVLPEKTTYFFPKAVSGVVFHSFEEKEDFSDLYEYTNK